MAVERLLKLVNESGDDAFHKLCGKLNVPKFTPCELAFLTEYVTVMKPVAQALNILQAEKKMYMGYLLPTITVLRHKIMMNAGSVKFCQPLVVALLDGIANRFEGTFCSSELIAAAILHPKFKMSWTDDSKTLEKGVQYIKHSFDELRQNAPTKVHQHHHCLEGMMMRTDSFHERKLGVFRLMNLISIYITSSLNNCVACFH